MRERAVQIGAQLNLWSEVGAGTEVELRIPAAVAYGSTHRRGGRVSDAPQAGRRSMNASVDAEKVSSRRPLYWATIAIV